MSIGGMMRTSISGMQAQSNRLSAVADNIANSDTNGYKRLRTDFSSMVLSSGGGRMASGAMSSAGGVLTSTRQLVSQQGSFEPSSSTTDLAIQGNGFFVVQDGSGTPYFTRAGSFVPDSNGTLINASGYYLLGYSLNNGAANAVANGFAGLQPVSIAGSALIATATTEGTFAANLPADATISTAALPSANTAASAYTNKSSLLAYDNLGRGVVLDVYMTKTAAETWEVSIFNQADATAGGFPYASGPLATQTLNFSPANGMLTPASATNISLTVPGGSAMTIDMANMTQLATSFTVSDADTNGNPPSGIEQVDISDDGTLYARYGDGSYRALYKIPLATVTSPDQMTALTGTVFSPNPESGAVTIGFADEGAFGKIISSSLEQSNVDIADELTSMIQSQRSYTANSKVFQTGSELMDVVVNLKR